MTTNNLTKHLQTALMLTAMGLLSMACNESPMEQQSDSAQADEVQEVKTSIKTGTRLSYTATKVMVSNNMDNGAKNQSPNDALFKEVQQVDVFVDNEGKRCEEFSRMLEHSHKKKGFDPALTTERITRNGQTSAFNAAGKLLYTTNRPNDGAKDGTAPDYSELLMTCAQRSEGLRLLIEQAQHLGHGISVEQPSDNVAKLIVRNDDGATNITYLNLKYGVPVKSEAYDAQGVLTSSLLQLYKLVDDIPVLAYEETIGYSTNLDGERIEHKQIMHYDNIKLEKF